MADTIGNITVPEIAPSGLTFPIRIDFPHTHVLAPEVVTHTFGSGNAKIEQRFYVGSGAERISVSRRFLTLSERDALLSFWHTLQGSYGTFTFNYPNGDGTTTAKTCRFADPTISFEYVAGSLCASTGLTLVLVPDPASAPTYAISSTVTRFPSAGLNTALLQPAQTIIPLLKIKALDPTVPTIYVSDRRVTVGGQLYVPRLLKFEGIQQTLNAASDQARFTFGNADRVMTQLVNNCDLYRATVEFSLFHVGTTIKLDLWAGHVTKYHVDAGPVFSIQCSDGAFDLGLQYPPKQPTRLCQKPFNNAAGGCPFSTQGALNLGSFPTASGSSCDRGFDTPNGCLAHTMPRFFGGIPAKPQTVVTKDNSTGGFLRGRSPLTSASMINDTLFNQSLPEIWCDLDDAEITGVMTDTSKGLPVNCGLVAGRDEGDFYCALGIVCAGPIGAFAQPRGGTVDPSFADDPNYPASGAYSPFKLDGQAPHGWPKNLNYGLRRSHGSDPATAFDPDGASDKFSLGEGGGGVQVYSNLQAAGVAFVEVRRKDESGLQPSALSDHKMTAMIRRGMKGYTWSGPGARSALTSLSNPAWIAVNAYLRGRGLFHANTAAQEAAFDLAAAIATANIFDTVTAKLVGAGNERQFTFQGVFDQEKPLRDWLVEILNAGLGYWSNAFGRLRIGTRNDSSVLQAFSEGNIIWNSLVLEQAAAEFNHLMIEFGDQEFLFAGNNVAAQDTDHAAYLGGGTGLPSWRKKKMSVAGVSTQSQALRQAATRLREELGGVNLKQWKALRTGKLRTTVLALAVEPGMVISVTHPDCPDYYNAAGTLVTANYIEGRVLSWALNPDYSIDLTLRTTNDSCYDLTVGPKPVDVAPDEVPDFDEQPPADWSFQVEAADGLIKFSKFACGTGGDTVHTFFGETFYIDEARAGYTRMIANMSASLLDKDLHWEGVPPIEGRYILIEGEAMLVGTVVPDLGNENAGHATVDRAQLGTTLAAHQRTETTISALNPDWQNEFTVPAGLAFKPGERLINAVSNQAFISEYDANTGLLRLALPIAGNAVGQIVYADKRVWMLEPQRNFTVSFPNRFFRSPNRSQFTAQFELPMAGIALVKGRLLNRRDVSSGYLIRSFVSEFPHRLRTGGHTSIELAHPEVPLGGVADLFQRGRAGVNQAFDGAFCEVRQIESGPVDSPRGVSAIEPAKILAGGSILIGGTIDATITISVKVSGGNEAIAPLWVAADNGITGASSASAVALSLCNWLNADPAFSSLFIASVSSATVSLKDKTGLGGTITADKSGPVTTTVSGFLNALGITKGRRYAITYRNSGGGYESHPGPLSVSTGPTGGASRIDISEIPLSTDPDVDKIRLYAAPDGQDGPLYRVAEVDNTATVNGFATAADTTTEGSLSGQPQLASSSPPLSGAVLLRFNRDGRPWFDLRISGSDGPRSNTVHFLALGSMAERTEYTVDCTNDLGDAIYLRAVLL